MEMNVVLDAKALSWRKGEKKGEKIVVFLFWKTAETLHHGRLIYCNGPQKKIISHKPEL